MNLSPISSKGLNVDIVILDHGSELETFDVIQKLREEYPFVAPVRFEREAGHDYSHAFQKLFQLTDAKWTWTFGDDDILLPGGLQHMLKALDRDDLHFIHVSEKKRTTNSGALHIATLAELCNVYGLLDMTGFITGNIVRTEKLKAAAKVESWDIYAKSAFVQSLALFEVLKNEKAAFLDWPIIDSQEEEQNDETKRRWTAFDIPTRYFYLIDGLEDMRNRGVIEKVNSAFFRYLSYYLWDRFCQNIVSSFTTTQEFKVTDMLYDLFDRTIRLTTFLPEHEAKRFKDELIELRESLESYSFALSQAMACQQRVDKLLGTHGVERFPFQYLKPRALDRDNAFMDKPTASPQQESPDKPKAG